MGSPLGNFPSHPLFGCEHRYRSSDTGTQRSGVSRRYSHARLRCNHRFGRSTRTREALYGEIRNAIRSAPTRSQLAPRLAALTISHQDAEPPSHVLPIRPIGQKCPTKGEKCTRARAPSKASKRTVNAPSFAPPRTRAHSIQDSRVPSGGATVADPMGTEPSHRRIGPARLDAHVPAGPAARPTTRCSDNRAATGRLPLAFLAPRSPRSPRGPRKKTGRWVTGTPTSRSPPPVHLTTSSAIPAHHAWRGPTDFPLTRSENTSFRGHAPEVPGHETVSGE